MILKASGVYSSTETLNGGEALIGVELFCFTTVCRGRETEGGGREHWLYPTVMTRSRHFECRFDAPCLSLTSLSFDILKFFAYEL